MTTTILRPTGWPPAVNTVTYYGGPNDDPTAALGDDTDSTGINFDLVHYATSETLRELTDLPALAAGQRIGYAQPKLRYGVYNAGSVDLHVILETPGGTQLETDHWTSANTFVSPRDGTIQREKPGGGEWALADINALRVRLRETGGGSASGSDHVTQFQLAVEIWSKPWVAVNGPTGAQRTRRPTVTWSMGGGGDYLDTANVVGSSTVKVFSEAQYTAAGFNPETSAATYTATTAPWATSHQLADALGDGTWRAYVKFRHSFNEGLSPSGAAWYSDWGYSQFTISDAPLTPTAITPAAGSTVATDVPTLGAQTTPSALGARVRVEWQLATDAGFTTNLRTVSQPTSALALGGPQSMVVPDAQQLNQGTWYLRARTVDEFGTTSGWSLRQQFTVSHPPSAAKLSPTGDGTIAYDAAGLVFDWDFTDPSPVDVQSAYQVEVSRNDDGTIVVDTGKTAATGTSATVVIPAAQKDAPLRWRVKVWDSDDVAGPWSSYQPFRTSDAPTVTITQPADAGTVNNPQPSILWTFAASGGRAQTAFAVQVIRHPTGTQQFRDYSVHWSGWISGNANGYMLPVPAVVNGGSYTVTVSVRDDRGLEASDSNNFTAQWTPPAAPPFTVDDTIYNTQGPVRVSWTNANFDPDFYSYRVYRRTVGDEDWTLLYETVTAADGTFDDWLVGAGSQVEYAVVQVANRFAQVLIESDYNPVAASTEGGDYWLIFPDDLALNVRLDIVTADDYDDEYEEETLELLDRGRKTDYGTHWGVKGQLSAQVYDHPDRTARQRRQDLFALKAQRREFYLRNPFGDVWQVTASTIHVGRIAGVGDREYVTVSFPYQQVQ